MLGFRDLRESILDGFDCWRRSLQIVVDRGLGGRPCDSCCAVCLARGRLPCRRR